MEVLGWILFGLVVGAIARLLVPGRDPAGCLLTIGIGIVGGLLGGLIGRALGVYGPGEEVGYLMAILGAVLLLLAWRVVARRRMV